MNLLCCPVFANAFAWRYGISCEPLFIVQKVATRSWTNLFFSKTLCCCLASCGFLATVGHCEIWASVAVRWHSVIKCEHLPTSKFRIPALQFICHLTPAGETQNMWHLQHTPCRLYTGVWHDLSNRDHKLALSSKMWYGIFRFSLNRPHCSMGFGVFLVHPTMVSVLLHYAKSPSLSCLGMTATQWNSILTLCCQNEYLKLLCCLIVLNWRHFLTICVTLTLIWTAKTFNAFFTAISTREQLYKKYEILTQIWKNWYL